MGILIFVRCKVKSMKDFCAFHIKFKIFQKKNLNVSFECIEFICNFATY